MADKPITQEIATTGNGRDITRPWIGPLQESQDRILQTRGYGNLEIYEKVREDDQVKATFQQRQLAIVSREWEVLPGGDKRIDRQAADFLRETLDELAWDSVTEKMMYGVFYGFGIAECLWARDGDRVTLPEIKVRNRRRFKFGNDNQPRLITLDKPLGEKLPDQKFWAFSTGADNDDAPYGLGLAHWLYWPVFFKRHGVKFWMIFLDKFGMPTPVGKYGPNASAQDQKKLLEACAAIQTDTGVIIPEGMLIELLEASRSGTAEYGSLYDKMDAAISKVVLSQTMTTDPGSSRSQAEVHMDVRADVVKSDSDLINGSFNRTVVRWLTDWNFPGAAYPKVWRKLEEEEDTNARADRDKTLFDMGFRLKAETVERVYGEGYLEPAATEDSEKPALISTLGIGGTQALVGILTGSSLPKENVVAILSLVFGIPADAAQTMVPEPQEQPQQPGPEILPDSLGEPSPANQQPFEFAETPPPDTVDDFAGRLRDQAGPVVDGWTNQIRELLEGSEDLPNFAEQLYTLYPQMEGQELTQIMQQAMMASSWAGAFEAQEEASGNG